MKYYADYFNERVYSVAPNGDAVCKRQIITTGQIVVNKFKARMIPRGCGRTTALAIMSNQ